MLRWTAKALKKSINRVIHPTLHYTPWILASFHHLVSNSNFLCAAYYSKWQMTLKEKKKSYTRRIHASEAKDTAWKNTLTKAVVDQTPTLIFSLKITDSFYTSEMFPLTKQNTHGVCLKFELYVSNISASKNIHLNLYLRKVCVCVCFLTFIVVLTLATVSSSSGNWYIWTPLLTSSLMILILNLCSSLLLIVSALAITGMIFTYKQMW